LLHFIQSKAIIIFFETAATRFDDCGQGWVIAIEKKIQLTNTLPIISLLSN